MQHITFIHVSDLHLDNFPPVKYENQDHAIDEVSVRLHEAPYEALKNLVSLCEEIKPQFLVFSGDIHEHGRLSLKARFALTEFFDYLEQKSIPLYYACGNHDHLGQNDAFFGEFDHVYRFGENWGCFTYPPASSDEAEAPLCTLLGISHTSRKELKNLIKDFPADFSLENFPDKENLLQTPFHIGVLHASVHNQEEVRNTDKHVVALCREGDFIDNAKKRDTLKSRMDYWALGHIHEPMVLTENPTLMYAGAMQATRMSETGMRGAIVVKMAKQGHGNLQDGDKTEKFQSVPYQPAPFQPARVSTIFYPLAPLEIYTLSLTIDEHAELMDEPVQDIPRQRMQVGKSLEENQENCFSPVESRQDCLTWFTDAFFREYAKIHHNPLCTARLFTLYLEGEHAFHELLQDEEFLAELQACIEKEAQKRKKEKQYGQEKDGQDTEIFIRSVKSLVRPCFHYEIAHKREDLLGEVFRVLEDIRHDPKLFTEMFRKIEQDCKIKNDIELDIFSYSDKYTHNQLEQFRSNLLHQCESICVKFLEPK